MLSKAELQRARELARASKGDALGLDVDPELTVALADAAASRFFSEASLEKLDEWAALVAQIKSGGALPAELSSEIDAHERLIDHFHRFFDAAAAARQPSLFRLAVEMALDLAQSTLSPLLERLAQDVKVAAR